MVRVVGVEPTLLAEPDFESGASTNSTTPARLVEAFAITEFPAARNRCAGAASGGHIPKT